MDLPPDDRITTREFARVDANPGAALARGRIPVEAAGRPRSRALRARAGGAQRRRRRSRGVGEAARPSARGRPALRQRADRVPRGAPAPPARRGVVSRGGECAPLSDAQRAWRVRAALRVRRLAGRPRRDRRDAAGRAQESAWRYWKARALAASGRAGGRRGDLRRSRRRDQLLRHAVGRGDRTAAGAR